MRVLLLAIVFPLAPVTPSALVIDLAVESADIVVLGAAPSNHCGYSLAIGDINGDGYQDLVIASYGALPLNGQRRGEVDVLWGPLNPSSLDLSSATPPAMSRILGKSGDIPTFCRLAVGDVNGDLCDDLLYAHPYGPDFPDGAAYLILGSATFPDTLDLQSNPPGVTRILGGPWEGLLGWAVAFGDVDGDGFDEAILSAPRLPYGEVYMIHGGPALASVYDMASPPSDVTRVVDHLMDNWTGESLACRDVDNDGRSELLIGSPGNTAGLRQGMATLLFGVNDLPPVLTLSDPGYSTIEFFGESFPDGRLGMEVEFGNLDGDTRPDVVLSAPYTDDGCFDGGTSYIVFDADQLPDTVFVGTGAVAECVLRGQVNYHQYGSTLLVANWVGDGRDDVVVRSRPDSSPGVRARLVAVSGGVDLPPQFLLHTDTTLTRVFEEIAGDHLGRSMVSGDLNNDGSIDIAVGASFADPLGRSNAGKCYVLFGTGTTSGAKPIRPSVSANPGFPNPFSTTTTVRYRLDAASDVQFDVYDVRGRLVRRLAERGKGPGEHEVRWDGRNQRGDPLPSGAYFYRLITGAHQVSGRMVIIR